MASLINSISLVILVCFLVLNYNGVGGDRRLSKKEDFELEKQLKLHNKPAIKTIQTGHGDIYDCVDFYKQPAFDHPLLKNHSYDFQMRPSSVPKRTRENKESATSIKPISIGLQDGGCPFRTVPIKRVTKDDLIRIKSHSKKYGSKYGVVNPEFPGNHFAVVRTKYDPLTKYNGGGGTLNIYNPLVGAQQYSASRLKIQNGPDYIIVGWMVFPALYGDNKTRLFTLLDQSGPRGCYHGFCSGFIAVNPSIPIGWVFDKVSTRGGPQYGIEILVFRDASTGNWWIAINNNGESYIQIGYWPKEIFIGLADLATLVEWGGEVFSAVNVASPKMGSGEYPIENTQFDAYYANITTLNAASEIVEAVTEEYSDVDSYRVIDKGNVEGCSNHLVLYGGPGGYIEP